MKAAKDTVVTLHYDVSSDGGPTESSRQSEPMHVLLGRGQLIEGIENAIHGHEAGDTFKVELAPEDAYGERQENAVQQVPRESFPDAEQLQPGMPIMLSLKDGGQRVATVHEVGTTTVDIDMNHPMAGKHLDFDVELLEVREAVPAELEHGHVHGPDTPAH